MEFREDGYVPIGHRPEWASISPLRPPPASSEVVSIQSDPDHTDLLAYFWAAVTAGEHSPRVLDLTEEIILNFNSAHFSVWAWRWECLEALGTLQNAEGIAAETALLRRVATENPKNYQLWNHRRKFALFRRICHIGDEMEFSAGCLAYDAKNYHAWAHRQAMLTVFGAELKSNLWAEELVFTERLLRDDVRNNSAWTQRYFILEKGQKYYFQSLGTPSEFYNREVDFVVVKINLAPHNDAAWVYLRALTTGPGAPQWSLGFEERIRGVCMTSLELDASNVPALDLLADFYVQRAHILLQIADSKQHAEEIAAEGCLQRRDEALGAAVEAAKELLVKLQVADPARCAYYSHKLRQLEGM